EAVAVHLGPRADVVNSPVIVVDLNAEQRLPSGPKRATVERAMICAARWPRVALTGAERIDGEDEKAELRQAQAARLYDRIAPLPRPMAMDDEDSRDFGFKRFGNVGARRHPHVRARLKEELFNAVAIAFQDSHIPQLQPTGLVRNWSHRGKH